MFPLKNTEAYIHANGFRSTLGKELADRDAAINELGSEIQALTNYVTDTGVKNILENTLVTRTDIGVTFTHQSDGTVLANGTNSGGNNTIEVGSFTGLTSVIISGCPSGGSATTYEVQLRDKTTSQWVSGSDYGSGKTISSLDATHTYALYIIMRSGYVANNVLFKPMVTEVDIPNSDYAHYQPYAKTNVELTQDVASLIITGTATKSGITASANTVTDVNVTDIDIPAGYALKGAIGITIGSGGATVSLVNFFYASANAISVRLINNGAEKSGISVIVNWLAVKE